jgi:hypothetical protein
VEPLASLHRVACSFQALHAASVERYSQVQSPESLPGCGQLRVVRAPGDDVGLRLHVVHRERVEVAIGLVRRRRKHRVRVVIERLDGVDVSRDLGVNLLLDQRLGAKR